MKGSEVKEKLVSSGFKLVDVAQRMGVIPQTFQSLLRTDDIKVGVLKEIAKAIGKDITFFFEFENENEDSKLQESQLAIEITKNSGRAYRLYQKIVSIDILLDKKFGIKNEDGYASGAAKILNDTFFKKYDFVVDGMTYDQKKQFNDQLKQAIDTFIDIFFERFKVLNTKLIEKEF